MEPELLVRTEETDRISLHRCLTFIACKRPQEFKEGWSSESRVFKHEIHEYQPYP